jgi:hypothetical protein
MKVAERWRNSAGRRREDKGCEARDEGATPAVRVVSVGKPRNFIDNNSIRV